MSGVSRAYPNNSYTVSVRMESVDGTYAKHQLGRFIGALVRRASDRSAAVSSGSFADGVSCSFMQFEWDPQKERANVRKHSVTFDEALTVFFDPLAAIHDDPDHSLGEYREIIVGHSARSRLLLVSFTERSESVVRIINARTAEPDECRDYEEND